MRYMGLKVTHVKSIMLVNIDIFTEVFMKILNIKFYK